MMVLPQLFLFQALPITLRLEGFFFLQKRKHRLKYELLTQVKEKGGLGAPNEKKVLLCNTNIDNNEMDEA